MKKITFPAKLAALNLMLDYIIEGARKYGFRSKKIDAIRLACEEVLVNIINYSYLKKRGDIEIKYNIKKGEKFEIVIADYGIPFNPLTASTPDVDAPVEKHKIGGLGIFLIRKKMDKVNYRRDQKQKKNILTLIKY